MDSFMPLSSQCIPTVLDLSSTIDAWSAKSAKQHASTLISEEINRLKNNISVYEQQILAWKEEIFSWKTRQNTLTNVATLPDDILLEIWSYFSEVAAESPEMQREWLHVTQVCSHWRTLALDTQNLWRWPCVMLPDLARRLLERAGPVLSHLLVDIDQISGRTPFASNARNIFILASELLQRAESLSLKVSNTLTPSGITGCEEFVLSLMQSGPYHRLKWLSITYDNPPSRRQVESEPDVTKLILSAPALTGIVFDNTSMLNLKSCIGDLTTVQIPPITLLDIRLMTDGPTQVLFRQLIETLGILPNLQSLTLVDSFERITHEDRVWSKEQPSPVFLPNLKSLWVADEAEECQFFFRHISYMQATEVTIEISGDAVHPMSLSALMAATANFDRLGGHCRGLEISIPIGGKLPAYFLGLYLSSNIVAPELSFLLKLENPTLLCDLLSICPLQQVETLWYDLYVSETEIWQTLGSLPHLSTIKQIEIEQHPTLMKVLASFRSSDDSIFDPPTNVDIDQTPGGVALPIPPVSLYFPRLEHIAPSDHASSNEEVTRILKVRKSWTQY